MSTSGTAWGLGRRPALDGLRGVAILLVVVHHSDLLGEHSAAGPLGVSVFFALSGYLITSLLLAEQAAGRVDLRRFYARRARRLFPALAFALAIFGGLGLITWRATLWTLTYAANWPQAHGVTLDGLNHTWSLAIEEQFYLVWPVVLILVGRRWGRAGVAWSAGLGATAAVLVRVILWATGASWDRLYFGSDVRADALLIGCVAAAVRIRAGRPAWLWLGLLLALIATPYSLQAVALPTAAALATVLVIASPARVLDALPLRYLGRRSYALYLWHFPLIFVVAPRLGLRHSVAVLFMLAAAWGMAEVSWRAVERPFLTTRGRERQAAAWWAASRASDSAEVQ